MPPQAAPPVRVDRDTTFPIHLGDTISKDSSPYSALKYNFKPTSSHHNPSSPTILPTPGTNPPTYTLTFNPPSSSRVTYTGSSSHPPPKRHHFILFDPTTRSFSLERLDSVFTFNADVFASAHPPIPREMSDDEDDDSDADEGGVYDYRNFFGKKKQTEAEKRMEKRKEALKRAGAQFVEVPPVEEGKDGMEGVVGVGTPMRFVEKAQGDKGDRMDVDSEMDAPGEVEEEDEDMEDDSDEDAISFPANPPPAPPPKRAPASKRAAPVPQPKLASSSIPPKSATAVGLGIDNPGMSFSFDHDSSDAEDTSTVPAAQLYEASDSEDGDEVLDIPVVDNGEDADGEEDLVFSDEDEDMDKVEKVQEVKAQETQQEEDEGDDDFLEDMLFEALDAGGEAEEERERDGGQGGGQIQSLLGHYGGGVEDSSESEEE